MNAPATQTSIAQLRGKSMSQGEISSLPREKQFPQMLESFKSEIARALPKHLNPERMARIALTAFRQTPKLAECDPRSVFAAVIQSSQLGLEVGLLGEAHLVPFSKSVKDGNQWKKTTECQLIPGYQGLMKLARNTGLVKDIYAHEVRANDEFGLTLGLDRQLTHKPLMEHGFPASEEKRGPITGFYAVAVFKDGSASFIAMSLSQVERIRDRSSGYKSAVEAAKKYNKENTSPWVNDFEAMGLKTVIRRLCKFMPKSPELASALELDRIAAEGYAQRIDLTEAIEGSYVPIARDDDEDKPEGEQPAGDETPPAEKAAAPEQKSAEHQAQPSKRKPGPAPDLD